MTTQKISARFQKDSKTLMLTILQQINHPLRRPNSNPNPTAPRPLHRLLKLNMLRKQLRHQRILGLEFAQRSSEFGRAQPRARHHERVRMPLFRWCGAEPLLALLGAGEVLEEVREVVDGPRGRRVGGCVVDCFFCVARVST